MREESGAHENATAVICSDCVRVRFRVNLQRLYVIVSAGQCVSSSRPPISGMEIIR